MAEQFDDLRDFLHRSGIGSPDGSSATALAGERALAGILARRRRPMRRRLSAIGAAAASILAAAVLAPTTPDTPAIPPTQQPLAALAVEPEGRTAAVVLDQAARAAQPTATYSAAGGSRAWYTWTRADPGHPDTAPVLTAVRPAEGGTVLLVAQSEGALTPDGRIVPAEASGGTTRVPDAPSVDATTDSVLAGILATPCAYDTIACALEAITALRTSPAPGAVISDTALWSALAAADGMSSPGRTIDRLGRPAAVVAADSVDGRHRIAILIDPATGRYLGTEVVDLTGPQASTVGFVAVV